MNDEARIERRAEDFRAACAQAGHWVGVDWRVGFEVAAELVGLTPDSFDNKVRGSGLRFYRLGGNGHRRTIDLRDLSSWIESYSEIL